MREWDSISFTLLVMRIQNFGCPAQMTCITERLRCEFCRGGLFNLVIKGQPRKKRFVCLCWFVLKDETDS